VTNLPVAVVGDGAKVIVPEPPPALGRLHFASLA
jgi:hypothetical protein